jgi:hypothetical protein
MAAESEVAAGTLIDTRRPSARPALPASQVAQIRIWVKYGMTVPQVAEVCGVPVGEIERVLRKAGRG